MLAKSAMRLEIAEQLQFLDASRICSGLFRLLGVEAEVEVERDGV